MKVAMVGSASRQAMHQQPLGGELKIKAIGSKVNIGGTKIEPQLLALEHSIQNLFNDHRHVLSCRITHIAIYIVSCRSK